MPRYFFDIFDGDHLSRDDFGAECLNDDAARRQGTLALVEIARDLLPATEVPVRLHVVVRTSSGSLLTLSLEFSTAS